MIITTLFTPFILSAIVLALIPGPNVALIVANSLAHGTRYSLLTVAGTSSAMIPQLILTIWGTGTFIALLADGLVIVRWLGVVYLVYLGIRQWRAPAQDLVGKNAQTQSIKEIYGRGFFVSLTNPKTILFYGAFFPQFITTDADTTAQLIALSCTFFAIVTTIDCLWALLANHIRKYLPGDNTGVNHLSGAFLIMAALLLALTRIK